LPVIQEIRDNRKRTKTQKFAFVLSSEPERTEFEPISGGFKKN